MSHFKECLDTLGISVLEQEPMKKHTTFQVGGPADYFVEPGNISELQAVLKLCNEEKFPYFILGNGSNLLVSDKGYRGVVIHIGKKMGEITVQEDRIRAGAGAPLIRISIEARNHSLTGLEFASGIPGSLGGAVVMNAGAYGGDISQVIEWATVCTKDGEIKRLSRDELELGYRRSCILPMNYIVLEAQFLLTPGEEEAIRTEMEKLSAQRKEKQPLEFPSAGSTFKRPKGYFAGKLIMDSGLAGFRVGGACVSEKHCGFVVNKGGATATDIMTLCRRVDEIVQEKFGVPLELEIRTLGDF